MNNSDTLFSSLSTVQKKFKGNRIGRCDLLGFSGNIPRGGGEKPEN